ncbi:MAG: hypothetical protein ACYC33_02050 [Thermoleophilia bacterium]
MYSFIALPGIGSNIEASGYSSKNCMTSICSDAVKITMALHERRLLSPEDVE